MNVLYEEDGSFKVGTILSEADSSLQVEAVTGKRSKIKAANVLLRFERIGLVDFQREAESLAEQIDIDFLWECCGQDEFAFQDLAAEYFGQAPRPTESAAVAMRLHGAPMYFYKKGKGRYKAAPEENLKAALAGLERKKREAEQMALWVAELKAGQLPETFRQHLRHLLFKPDKNGIEWKALAQAADEQQLTPLRLLERVGAIPSVHAYFLQGFLLEHFPKGEGFAEYEISPPPAELPEATVEAFSIDDATTTEIDDAFSVQPLEGGNWRIGIHIAAPTLGILPGSPLDQLIRDRLSTVYMPGHKITMLPDSVVEAFTLEEGMPRPAVSLYVDINPAFEILHLESRVEKVHVAANLRHDALEPLFNEETLARPDMPDYPYKDELTLLWHFANALEVRRGKAEHNGPVRLDYSFYIDRTENEQGQIEAEKVRIVPRKRGAPMDKLVAELMILVNSEWGRMLAEAKIAAIYRAQAAGKVRMTTAPSPHQGLGVAQYSWASSPLRRAVDFVNQQQLLAMLLGVKPRYAANDANLFSLIGAFDAAYAAYAEFQSKMEHYWCLRYLEQENITEPTATVIKENLVRFDGMPLVQRIADLPEQAAGTQVRLQRLGMDFLDLRLECRFVEVLSSPQAENPEVTRA